MGAQLSKTAGKGETVAEKPGEAAASPTKTNGQVNDILSSPALCIHQRGNVVALEGAALRRRNPCVIVDKLNGGSE